jgi:hypothetical protein
MTGARSVLAARVWLLGDALSHFTDFAVSRSGVRLAAGNSYKANCSETELAQMQLFISNPGVHSCLHAQPPPARTHCRPWQSASTRLNATPDRLQQLCETMRLIISLKEQWSSRRRAKGSAASPAKNGRSCQKWHANFGTAHAVRSDPSADE